MKKKLDENIDFKNAKFASLVFDNTVNGILITDKNGKIIKVNRALEKLSGYSQKELLGKNPRVIKSSHHPREFFQSLWESLQHHGYWKGQIHNRRKDGSIFIAIQSITLVQDEEGEPLYYIGILNDITEQKSYEDKMRYIAHYDTLTKLPNRNLFYDRFEHALLQCKRDKTNLALLFIDLDGFKKINDTKGHPVGDDVLLEVSSRLKKIMRKSDTIARLGGDEFTVMIENFKNINALVEVINKILKAVSKKIEINGENLFLSASIGVSVYPNDGEDSHSLIKHADTAMYKAKDAGKNAYFFYEAKMTKQVEERTLIENSIRDAIANKEFQVYYQPKLSLKKEKIIGMEALVRWIKPDGTIIAPDKFIPIAEELNIVDKIDMYVLKTACKDVKYLNTLFDKELKVAVNLSGYNITKKDIRQIIQKILKETQFNPKLLELEITETYFLNFDSRCIKRLKKIKESGIKLSIDDFGTGYSSLSNLKKLPVKSLKIDRSFISILKNNTKDYNLVQSIIQLSHGLKLKSIAEGVEENYQLNFLKESKCDMIQGYLISKPLPLNEFILKVQEYNEQSSPS